MTYEEIETACTAFKAKTDIKDKGVAMCELTQEEIDEGAASSYFQVFNVFGRENEPKSIHPIERPIEGGVKMTDKYLNMDPIIDEGSSNSYHSRYFSERSS